MTSKKLKKLQIFVDFGDIGNDQWDWALKTFKHEFLVAAVFNEDGPTLRCYFSNEDDKMMFILKCID